MVSWFDVLPTDIYCLIMLHFSRKEIKNLFKLTYQLEKYYQNNKENFWLHYYRERINGNYRYKGYKNLKNNFVLHEPDEIPQANEHSYLCLQNFNYKSLQEFAFHKLNEDVLPSKKILCAVYLRRMDLLVELKDQGCTNYEEMFLVAVCSGDENIIDYLLTSKDSFCSYNWRNKAISSAINSEQVHIVKKLFKLENYDSNYFDEHFELATIVGNDDIIDYLLSTGYKIQKPEKIYRTSVIHCNLKVFKYIIPFVKNIQGFTGYLTLFGDCLPILEEMIDVLKEKNLISDICYIEMLTLSILHKDAERVNKYLPYYKQELKLLPEAACTNNLELMKFFISQGENDYIKAIEAAFSGKSDLAIEYLLSLADDSKNLEYFYASCHEGDIDWVKRIFEKISSDVSEEVLNQALFVASMNKNGLEICQFIISHGANGVMTPFEFAADEYKIYDIAEYLGRHLLMTELDDDTKSGVYMMLFGIAITTDNVDLMKILYASDRKLIDDVLPQTSDIIKRTGNIQWLKYLMDNGADVSLLKSNSLYIDPSIVYIIDNYMR